MAKLRIGDRIPDFTLPDEDGKPVKPSATLSKFVVIYFYPKALTSGCTLQACAIRDHWRTLTAQDISIYGVSPDEPKILKKFKEKEQLPFPLLSDSKHEIGEMFEVWKEKSMYGRTYMGMLRDSFVFDKTGTLIGVLHNAKPATHLNDILSIISSHGGSSI